METMLIGVRHELMRLGVTNRYRGYEQTVCAVEIAAGNPESLTLISKLIYPDVARHFDVSWHVVERNIRTIIDVIWDTNPGRLSELAGHQLLRKPKTSDFIAILANSVAQQYK